MIHRGEIQASWSKPPDGIFKLNFDAAWNDHTASLGFILRDLDEFVHGGGLTFQHDVANSM